MIKSILLATDGSDHAWTAWKYAFDLARACGAWLRVLSVVDLRVLQTAYPIPVGEVITFDAPPPELVAEKQTVHEELVKTVRSRSMNGGVTVMTEVARGAPAELILANEAKVDLIALGHQGGRSMMDRTFALGSVAEEVTHRATRPVLITPQRHAIIKRILVAYDGSEPARRALQRAAEMATVLQLGVNVLHVSRNTETGEMIVGEAMEYLRPYHIAGARALVRRGDVAATILQAAEDAQAGMIAMGAHSHGALHEALLGSVTASVLQQMDRPVLMTR